MSAIRKHIAELSQTAQRYLRDVESARNARSIQAKLDTPAVKTPISDYRVRYVEEGVETPYVGREDIDLNLPLPARRASWDLRDARYRLEIELRAPGSITAVTDAGTQVFKNRRVYGRTVLDAQSGSLTIEATEPIEYLSLSRYHKRAEGEIVIGPFRRDGFVSAKPIGHGTWTAEVAENVETGLVWNGEALVAAENDSPDTQPYGTPRTVNSLLWSDAEGLGDLAPLDYTSRAQIGKVYTGAEEVTYTGARKHTNRVDGPADFWAEPRRWRTFGQELAPDMDAAFGYWTHVWGTITINGQPVDKAYDLITGEQVSPNEAASRKGAYLVKVETTKAPTGVEIDGRYSAHGEALRLSTDPAIVVDAGIRRLETGDAGQIVPPGTYWKMPYSLRAPSCMIRIKGSGILRAVEIKTETNLYRPTTELTDTIHRESLATYKSPDTAFDRTGRQPGSGRGLFLPVRR